MTFIHDDRSRRDVETIQTRLGKPMKRIRVDKDLDQLEKVRALWDAVLTAGLEGCYQGSPCVELGSAGMTLPRGITPMIHMF